MEACGGRGMWKHAVYFACLFSNGYGGRGKRIGGRKGMDFGDSETMALTMGTAVKGVRDLPFFLFCFVLQTVCRRCYRGNLASIHSFSINFQIQASLRALNQAQVWIGGRIRGLVRGVPELNGSISSPHPVSTFLQLCLYSPFTVPQRAGDRRPLTQDTEVPPRL